MCVCVGGEEKEWWVYVGVCGRYGKGIVEMWAFGWQGREWYGVWACVGVWMAGKGGIQRLVGKNVIWKCYTVVKAGSNEHTRLIMVGTA